MNYHNVVFETSFGKASQLTKSDLVEIAFAGRSNVGKSSLINKIFNRKALARVSAVPGKTATINFFKLENVRFADFFRIELKSHRLRSLYPIDAPNKPTLLGHSFRQV